MGLPMSAPPAQPRGPSLGHLRLVLQLLASALWLSKPRGAGANGAPCTEADDALCIRCPTPASARHALARSALPALSGLGITGVPLLDAHLGHPIDPSDPAQQLPVARCSPYTAQCGRAEASCAVQHLAASAQDVCPAPRFAGRAQPITVVAAVSIAAADDDRLQSTVVTGPATPSSHRLLPAATAQGGVRVFNASALDGAAGGFSSAVAAGRWIFYIPGCFSDHTTVAVFVDANLNVRHLCTTIVRYDTLCGSGRWEDASCFQRVDLRELQRFFYIRNKINFGSAVYDGSRYLYLISGTGDSQRAPIAAFARLDTLGALTAETSWRVVNALGRTQDRAGSFGGGATDGRYLYFSPGPLWPILAGGAAERGQFLRYDTRWTSGQAPSPAAAAQNFWAGQGLEAEGWDAFELVTLHRDCLRFSGAAYDGHRYVYLAPAGHSKIVRFDRRHPSGFGSAAAYTYVDVLAHHLCLGFQCAAGELLGGYGLVIADNVLFAIVSHQSGSLVLRHEVTGLLESDGDAWFDKRTKWQCRCVHKMVDAAVQRELSFGTRSAGLTKNSFWFGGGTYDGRRYVYLVPSQAGNGPLVRLDTWGGFDDIISWEAAELHLTHPWLGAAKWSLFGGAATDGRYLYMVPNDYMSRFGDQLGGAVPGGLDYRGLLVRFDPQPAVPAFKLSVASSGTVSGGSRGRGVSWTVAAGAVAQPTMVTVASGSLLGVGTHVIVASFTPDPSDGSPPMRLWVDDVLVATERLPASAPGGCQWTADGVCEHAWGDCSEPESTADCTGVEYGGGSPCAPTRAFWNGDLVDLRVWGRSVSTAQVTAITQAWVANGKAPPALPPPSPPTPPSPASVPATGGSSTSTGTSAGTSTGTSSPQGTAATTSTTPSNLATADSDAIGMLVPIIISGTISLGALAAGLVSCVRRKRKASGKYAEQTSKVQPVRSGEGVGEDPDTVVERIEVELAKGAEPAGVAQAAQWRLDGLRRWLDRAGGVWTPADERSVLLHRVRSRWLQMSDSERAKAARGVEAEAAAGTMPPPPPSHAKPPPEPKPANAPATESPAADAQSDIKSRQDAWLRENGPGARMGAKSQADYAAETGRERQAREEKQGRDQQRAQQEERAAWEKERERRQAAAAEEGMEAASGAAAAAAKARQEAAWAEQKAAQRKREEDRVKREAALAHEKERYKREQARRVAAEQQQKQAAATAAQNKRKAAKEAEDARLREIVRARERERQEQSQRAAQQQRQRQQQQQQQQVRRTQAQPATHYDDGVRVAAGGDRAADAALQRRQDERVREMRENERKKEREAREVSQVQRQVDGAVDRWASSKDLSTMLATMSQIWPEAAAALNPQSRGAGIKKAYMKALRLVHPDKVDANAPVRRKVMAQRLFTTLQQHRPG
jgi:hypothetical protein